MNTKERILFEHAEMELNRIGVTGEYVPRKIAIAILCSSAELMIQKDINTIKAFILGSLVTAIVFAIF